MRRSMSSLLGSLIGFENISGRSYTMEYEPSRLTNSRYLVYDLGRVDCAGILSQIIYYLWSGGVNLLNQDLL